MKDCLKSEVNQRIQFVVNDCSTFIRVRHECAGWYATAAVGGGNFMMAQSLFSALNFVAKVYARLRHRDKYFYRQQNKDDVKSAVMTLRAIGNQPKLKELSPEFDFRALLSEDALTQWKPPRPGDCVDETKVFKMLVEEMSGSVDLGFSAKDAGDVWRQFRNALAHMAAPKSMVETGGPTGELRSFRKPSVGDWICNVDRLTEDVQAVGLWLCDKIEHEADEDRITDTLGWILGPANTSKSGYRILSPSISSTSGVCPEIKSVAMLTIRDAKP